MKAGVSFSNQTDSLAAGRAAAARAVNVSGPPVLTLVFTTDSHEPAQVLAGVKSVVSPALVAGFCCGGVLTAEGVQNRGVGVLALSGDFQAATTLQEGLDRDPFTAGQKAGLALQQAGLKNGTTIVLPDGFQANMMEMLRGLYGQLGPDFQYIGGGAGDNLKFFKTSQFTEQGVAQNALAVALVSGLNIGSGIEHGWTPVGTPLVINRSQGKRAYEINGVPAFLEYSRRLGLKDRQQFAALALRHPLGFPNIFGQHVIRDPLRVNEDDSLDFVSEIPSQAVGQIMECSIKGLVEAARKAAEQAILSVAKPGFILLFDCISRLVLMGDSFHEEIHALREVIGPDVPMLGALAFGEIGSLNNGPLFHNKTVVVAVGSEV
jgi:hypothetical protein